VEMPILSEYCWIWFMQTKRRVDRHPRMQRAKRRKLGSLSYDQSFVYATICTVSFQRADNSYATTLRPLRPHCLILHVRPTPPSALIPRLQKICHLEKIKADARALTLLADSNEGDLRSCINSLQLLATKCNNLTLNVVQDSLAKAKKEGSLDAHAVVEGVFAKRTAKDKRRLNLIGEIEGQRVVHDVNACAEFERIMTGTVHFDGC